MKWPLLSALDLLDRSDRAMLSKREKYIVAVAILALVIFVFDRFALTPLLDRKSEAEAERVALISDMERATSLFELNRRFIPKWNQMLNGGLGSKPADTESKILHALSDWSQEAGLKLSSVKPDRVTGTGLMREITFQVAAIGRMSAVVRFLWRLETASLPVRVKEVQLGSAKEGADDLSLQLRISALYIAEETKGSGIAGPARTLEGDNR